MKHFRVLLALFLVALPFSTAAVSTESAVTYLLSKGYAEGYSDGAFHPERTINRAEFTKILTIARGGAAAADRCLRNVRASPWSDVRLTDWFAKYLCVGYTKDVIRGYSDGTFKPGNPINAAEAAKIVALAYGFGPYNGSPWYEPYMRVLQEHGAFPDSIGSPATFITRGEMAQMITVMDGGDTAVTAQTKLNIAYGTSSLQRLDVLVPEGASNAPIAVLVHGGGWQKGDKSSMTELAGLFLRQGYIVMAPNYRLTSDGVTHFPDPIEDIACAVGWMQKHAEEFDGDATRMVMGGVSAGGHLAAMLAYDREDSWDATFCKEEYQPSFSGFFGIVGVYDFDVVEGARPQGEAFLGPLASPEEWSVAEPINFVSAGDPPAFLLGGENDNLVSPDNAVLFSEALKGHGIDHTLIIAPGYGHNADEYLLQNTQAQASLNAFLQSVAR